MDEILQQIVPSFDKAIEHFDTELARIRTGQASPTLLDGIIVDLFEQPTPLQQLAGISVPERRQLLVQPWDKSYTEPIEKALHKADLGASPIVEGNAIRISLPPMTQEDRVKLVKVASEKGEETRQVIRRAREDAWNKLQDAAKKGDIPEDQKFKGKDELQKIVDQYNEKVEAAITKKKVEIQGE